MIIKNIDLKYEKYCLQCGKKFKTNKSNVVVCGPKCALKRKREKDRNYWQKYYETNKDKILEKNRGWWKKNYIPADKPGHLPYVKKPVLTKQCAICHEEFTTSNPTTEYCLLHRYRRFAAGIYTKSCIYCKKEFLTKAKNRDHCSDPKCVERHQKAIRKAREVK